MSEKFEGFYIPNSTQVPDALFDDWMHNLSGAELKVVLYITRRTFGFRKMQDAISLSQMVNGITKKDGSVLDHGTGLSKSTVAVALKSLEKKMVIMRSKQRSASKGDEPTQYILNLVPVSGNRTPPSAKIGHGGVRKSDTQYTGGQDTGDNTVNGNDITSEQNSRSDEKTTEVNMSQKRSLLFQLPHLDLEADEVDFIVDHTRSSLKDHHSLSYHYLVASRVPQDAIRKALSEIKNDGGADKPAAVFAHRMEEYARGKLDNVSSS